MSKLSCALALLVAAPSLVMAQSAPAPQGTPSSPAAQAAADDSIATAVRRAATRHDTRRAVLWVHANALPADQLAKFAAALDTGIAELERLLGRTLDRAHYAEDTIHVFVADGIGVSHVYGGYSHPRFDRPYLYLDAARVRAGEAPYLHEATHLLVWKFGSHSLREGIASWAESEVLARGVGVGSGLFGSGSPAAIDQRAKDLLDAPAREEVLPVIGRAGLADRRLTSPERPRIRSAYYTMSQSFAQYLVRTFGIPTALRLYEEVTTDEAYEAITGKPLERLKEEWLAALRG